MNNKSEGKHGEKRPGMMDLLRSRYARSLLSRYKWRYLIGIAFLFVIDVLQTRVPIIVGGVVDGVRGKLIGVPDIWTEVGKLALIALAVLIGRIAWRWFIFGAARKIERDMRDDLFSHLEKMPAVYFQEHNAGEIMAHMTNDIETVRMAFAQTVMMALDALTIGAVTIYNMFNEIDPKLTVLAVLPLTLVAVTTAILGRKLHRRFTKKQETFSDLSDFAQEKLNGVKVIKAFVQEDKEDTEFRKVNLRSQTANIRTAQLDALMQPIMQAISGFSMAIAIGYGGYIAILGRITVGDFSAFIQYLGMLVWPMASVGRIINSITRGSASLTRIEKMLYAPPSVCDAPDVKAPQSMTAAIEVKHLTYRYPGTDVDVLHDVSFRVEAGQTLGIVGRTGSGKTTLVNLFLRIFDPPTDEVFVGEHDVRDLPLQTLRRSIGYVPQDNFLFSDTISANIAFGDRRKTQEDVEAAAKAACVHDNIIDFTKGYDTLVGERGVSLSGGQKQRISIARALILDPSILVLDDSVSAVDTDTEQKIMEHIYNTRAGKTNVIIAHRISTLQKADLIIVIDDGAIVERGNHEQLVALGGLYSDLYHKQLLEEMNKEEFAI